MIVSRRSDLVTDPIFEATGEPGKDSTVPGPAGKDSTVPGPKGEDGRGFNLRGKWRRTTYEVMDVVTHEGSSYVATAPTKSEPPGKAWQLLAARGTDGEDGHDGVGQRGRPGRDGVTTIVGGGGGTPFIAEGNILKGHALIVSSAGHCSPGLADVMATAAVVGLATSDVADGMAGLMLGGGSLELEDWSPVTGSASLSPGVAYYLSTTIPGGLTITPPDDDDLVVVFIGRALSTTVLSIEIANPIQLGDSDDWPEEE